jgi:hypothetical protein
MTAANVEEVLKKHVSPEIMTDEASWYNHVGDHFNGGRQHVTDSKDEYVRGEVYANTVEGFFSILKRGIIGTFPTSAASTSTCTLRVRVPSSASRV